MSILNSSNSFILYAKRWIIEKGYILLLSFSLPMAIFAFAMVLNGVYPHSPKTILSSDLNNSYVDQLAHIRSVLLGQHNYQYKWEIGLGNSSASGMYNSFFNLVLILFKQSSITDAIYFIILLKIGVSGLMFALCLMYSGKNSYIIVYSLCYALSGWVVAMHPHLMVSWDGFIYLPLVILGIEKLFAENKFLLLVISLAICMISNWYTAFFVCVFTAFYFMYKIALLLTKENKKKLLLTTGSFAISAIAAFCLAGIILIPVIIYIKSGGLYQDKDPLNFYLRYSIPQLLSKMYFGTYDTNRPNGIPFIYCGIFPLILFILSFFQKITIRERICNIAFFLIVFSALTINPLYIAIHGFDAPSWFEGRFSFAVSFFVLFLSYKTFKNFRNIEYNYFVYSIISIFLIFFILLFGKNDQFSQFVTSRVVQYNVIVILLFLLIMFFLFKSKINRSSASIVLFLLVVIEITGNTIIYIQRHERQETKEPITYNNYISDIQNILECIPENEREYFRIEKDFYRRETDAASMDYKSVSANSIVHNDLNKFFNKNYSLNFQERFSLYGNDNNAVLDSILGIKYILSRDVDKYFPYPLFKKIGDTNIYKNDYAINIINTVNNDIRSFNINKYENPYELDNALLNALSGEDVECFKRIIPENIQLINLTLQKSETRQRYAKITRGTTASIAFDIPSLNSENPQYFAITARENNVNIIMNDVPIASRYKINSNYNIKPNSPYTHIKLDINTDVYDIKDILVYYLDMEVFKSVMNKVLSYKPEYIIFKDTKIRVKLHSDNEFNYLYTSIPYDKGWHVKVDNTKVDTIKILNGAFIGVKLTSQGDHVVDLTYTIPGLNVGIALSILTLITLIILCSLKLKKKEIDNA